MIEEAISYPFEGDDAITTLFIGSMLIFAASALYFLGFLLLIVLIGFVFFPLAIVVGLPVGGYYVDVLRTTVQGRDEPPQFDDWGRLFVDGIKAAIVTFVYSIVPTAIFVVLGFVLIGAGGATGDASGGILSGLGILVWLLAIPVYLVVAYVTPAALTNFAVQDDLSAAFDFSLIGGVITDSDYVIAAVIAIVISGVAGFVASILYTFLIGVVISPFIYFYAYVAASRLFGKAYLNATESGRDAAGQEHSTV